MVLQTRIFFLVNHFSRTRKKIRVCRTTFLQPEKKIRVCRTTFLEPHFYIFLEKWLQIKWPTVLCIQGENRLVCIFGGLPISNAIVNNALACRNRNFSLEFAGLKVCKTKVVVLLSTYTPYFLQ